MMTPAVSERQGQRPDGHEWLVRSIGLTNFGAKETAEILDAGVAVHRLTRRLLFLQTHSSDTFQYINLVVFDYHHPLILYLLGYLLIILLIMSFLFSFSFCLDFCEPPWMSNSLSKDYVLAVILLPKQLGSKVG